MLESKYRSDVDGLRAVAVIMVLLFHAGLGFPGGYIGVDVFFVISGFLITGLILKDIAEGKFTLAEFWNRRIRRIIPASTFVVVATLVAGGFVLWPSNYEELAKSSIAQQLMFANVFFWRNSGDYFGGAAELSPLLHTWSLAVEEQFYIGYPFVLLFLKRFSRWTTIIVLAVLGIASFALSELGLQVYPTATFYLLPSRAWELIMGGLICFAPAPTRLNAWIATFVSWIGITTICIAGWCFNSNTRFPGATAFLPCMGTALIIYANATQKTAVSKILAARPIVFIGLISYSLYLWHWPIIAYMRIWQEKELSTVQGTFALIASFGLACLSWHFIETPFRKDRVTSRLPRVAVLGAIVSGLVVITLGTSIWFTGGARFRFTPQVLQAYEDRIWTGKKFIADRPKGAARDSSSSLPILGDIKRNPPRILILGDSHAICYSEAMHSVLDDNGLGALIGTQAGAPPIFGLRLPKNPERNALAQKFNDRLRKVAMSSDITDVVLIARWSLYIEGWAENEFESRTKTAANETLVGDAFSINYGTGQAAAAFERCSSRMVLELRAAGKRVWIVKQVPEVCQIVSADVLKAIRFGAPLQLKKVEQLTHNARQERANAAIDKLAKEGATIIDPSGKLFDRDGFVITVFDGRAVYRDEDHLTRFGATKFLLPVFEKIFCPKNSLEN
jgi:peptidoglycan/LPS O-acetylase OafA/YrhL